MLEKKKNTRKAIEKYLKSLLFWLPKVILVLLVHLHDFTKAGTCRTLADLFIYQNGGWLDTLVLIAFFIDAGIIIYFDYKFLVAKVIYGIRNEAIIIMQEDEWEA